MKNAPRRLLTDWTTSAGLDGTGLLALVLDGATPEGIHLATLGYEVFVLHADDAAAGAAEQAAHVHHVASDSSALPAEWSGRFDLVVAIDAVLPVDQLAPAGVLFVASTGSIEAPGDLIEVLRQRFDDPERPGVQIERAVLMRRPAEG